MLHYFINREHFNYGIVWHTGSMIVWHSMEYMPRPISPIAPNALRPIGPRAPFIGLHRICPSALN